MSIEDRLTRALAAEAETLDVDVEDLRTRTRERLAGPPGAPERAPRRISRGPLLASRARVHRRHRHGRRHVPGDRGT